MEGSFVRVPVWVSYRSISLPQAHNELPTIYGSILESLNSISTVQIVLKLSRVFFPTRLDHISFAFHHALNKIAVKNIAIFIIESSLAVRNIVLPDSRIPRPIFKQLDAIPVPFMRDRPYSAVVIVDLKIQHLAPIHRLVLVNLQIFKIYFLLFVVMLEMRHHLGLWG